jgi:Protein of unknown function (DUF4435)
MQQHLAPDRLANSIRMQRQQVACVFLIVEGATDARVFKHLIQPPAHCQIKIAHDKAKALQVAEILNNDQFPGVVVVIDADFDRLEGTLPNAANIFLTDSHDLDTMLFCSPALDKLLEEMASHTKLETFQSSEKSIREVVSKAVLPLGYLRWLSLKQGLNLTFGKLDFKDFIDKDTLECNVIAMIRKVKGASSAAGQLLKENELAEQIRQLASAEHDVWQVCCGHDLVGALSVALRKVLGNENRDPTDLEGVLRLAFDAAYFKETALYRDLQAWASEHAPYAVLRNL